jgi:hypothetical protein
MDLHKKGRTLMNADNKTLIFLGAYVAACAAFFAFCTKFVDFRCCCRNNKNSD